MKVRRLPPHDVSLPTGYEPAPEDRQPGTTTVRCMACGRTVFYGMSAGWVHCIQTASPDRHLWRLSTRHGSRNHYDMGDGATACGIHLRRRVEEIPVQPTGEFGGGFQDCRKCQVALDA